MTICWQQKAYENLFNKCCTREIISVKLLFTITDVLPLWRQSNREIPLCVELCGSFALYRLARALCLFINGHESPSIVKFIEITLTITIIICSSDCNGRQFLLVMFGQCRTVGEPLDYISDLLETFLQSVESPHTDYKIFFV